MNHLHPERMFLLQKLYSQILEPVCKAYGITRMELDILLFLANNPQYDTAAEIIRYRHLTKSHVSTSVRQLLDRGYLEGFFSKNNQKSVHLRLLAPASPVIEEGRSAQKQFFSLILQGLTPAEIEVLNAAFDKIEQNMQTALRTGR